jgi:hypothetical protein
MGDHVPALREGIFPKNAINRSLRLSFMMIPSFFPVRWDRVSWNRTKSNVLGKMQPPFLKLLENSQQQDLVLFVQNRCLY